MAGIAIGLLCELNGKAYRLAAVIQRWAFLAIIFVLGFGLGQDENLLASLGEIGVEALTIAVLCSFLSIAATFAIFRVFRKRGGQK